MLFVVCCLLFVVCCLLFVICCCGCCCCCCCLVVVCLGLFFVAGRFLFEVVAVGGVFFVWVDAVLLLVVGWSVGRSFVLVVLLM